MQPCRSSVLLGLAGLVSLSCSGLAQAAWSRHYPPNSPPPRARTCFGLHGATGAFVIVFGEFGNNQLNDGWILNGSTWRQMSGPMPPFRRDLAMAYDSVRERLVMFSGTTQLRDTWEWNGQFWIPFTPARSPSARSHYAMAFDPLRGVTVLYGGAGPHELGDLWEWDGVNWTAHSPVGGPGPRSYSLMAFDTENDAVLLFGGTVGSAIYNDTWSWDGTAWREHFPATPPTHRIQGRMVTDFARRRVLLHGGHFNSGPWAWEWDGEEWRMQFQASPSERINSALAYDVARRRVVLVGGELPSGPELGDVWWFETASPARARPYESGCAGTAGVSELAAARFQLPWLGDTYTNEVRSLAPTSGGVFFVTGFDPIAPISLAGVGMPGCSQHVSPLVAEFVPATNGAASWSLTIPNASALASVRLVQQVVALDAGANAAGLTVSNGLEMTVGIR